jgi:hypothetical protein
MPFFYFAKKTFASTGIPSRHVKRRRKPPPVLHRRALTVRPIYQAGKKKSACNISSNNVFLVHISGM